MMITGEDPYQIMDVGLEEDGSLLPHKLSNYIPITITPIRHHGHVNHGHHQPHPLNFTSLHEYLQLLTETPSTTRRRLLTQATVSISS